MSQRANLPAQTTANTVSLTEQALKKAQKGDYQAFEVIHYALEPPITRFVRRLLGDHQDYEDIVQDTFLALYMHIDRVQSLEHLRPYVFRIARNNCYDYLRKVSRYDEVGIEESPESESPHTPRLRFQLQDNSAPPDELTHWLLISLEVREAIDQLPEGQRDVLMLFAEEGLSYNEIAEVMDISLGTVKSRLYHAKRALRGMVRPEVLLALNG